MVISYTQGVLTSEKQKHAKNTKTKHATKLHGDWWVTKIARLEFFFRPADMMGKHFACLANVLQKFKFAKEILTN